ncbi:MAG: hypothetical protein AB7L09_15630 [Nitrospira sp.]
MDRYRFAAKAPFQDGGIATRIYAYGDSNNGDSLYPKTWLYLGGWGTATMYKEDQLIYKGYDAHFVMVMERSRDLQIFGNRGKLSGWIPIGHSALSVVL